MKYDVIYLNLCTLKILTDTPTHGRNPSIITFSSGSYRPETRHLASIK